MQGRIQDFKLGGGAFLGYFLWKIAILCQKNHVFSNFRGPPGKGVFLKIKSGTVVPSEFEPPFPLHIFHRHVNNTHSYIRDTGTTSMHIQLQASHLYLKSKISTYRSMLHLIMWNIEEFVLTIRKLYANHHITKKKLHELAEIIIIIIIFMI
jgi:hypothetical protein